MLRHGGELLADTLIAHGVTEVFGMPGGQANAFYDALSERTDKIRHTLIRDETTAAFAADAYARVTGQIAVCDATVGPGATKFPAGLMEAHNSSIPVLALLSGHPRNTVLLQDHGRISQGGDQMSMLKPFTKENFVVPSVEMIPKVIAAAIHTAVSGRPGVVAVEIPQDVFLGTSEVDIAAGTGQFPKYRCVPPQKEITAAAELLATSKRPLILAGGGVFLSGAHEELTAFSKAFNMPVVTTLSGKGAVPENSELCFGVLGDFGNPAAKRVADEADVILALGYKHSQNSSYRWTWPKPNQKLIHVDTDPTELGRVFQPELPLLGDVRETLVEMSVQLKRSNAAAAKEWVEFGLVEKNKWLETRNEEWDAKNVPIWPQAVMKVLNELLGPDDYLVCDASFSSGWGAAYFDSNAAGRRVILPRGAAGLGFSMPAGIGISRAKPGSRVVCLSGDGAFGYNVGELATLIHYGLNVKCIVLNNSVLAWSKWTQRLNMRGVNHAVELGSYDFAQIATGFGITGISIGDFNALNPGLIKAMEEEGPSVVNIWTEQWQTPSISYREAMKKAGQGEIVNKAY